MNCRVFCVVFLIAFALVEAGPAIDDHKASHINSIHSNDVVMEENLLRKLKAKCYNGDFSPCMVFLAVNYFNDMLKKPQADFGAVEITKNTNSIFPETSRSLKDMENLSDEAQLTQLMADKLYDYVKTRSMKWHVTDGADLVIAGRSDQNGGLNVGISLQPNGATEEGRKKKDQGNMSGLIAAAMMKVGILKALAFKALIILVGKAVLVSKLALVLAVIIGLKKLLSNEKHVTYEVVAQPHHDHHEHHVSGGGHDSWGGGYARNFETKEAAQNLAYSAQIPPN
ncbi:osiris 3 [Rhynchophorus ferrugineus]|uniref:Uncharacterized protein n=1 Tax=Rhynchophorus ferrugineus TaxID=354439 RepID=A0A834M1S1_RHYFE|nr:hypothetical protein GWI33_019045 [Rhynchophorus ferrugineus]